MWKFASESPYLFTLCAICLSYYITWAIRGMFIRKPDSDGK